MSSFGFTFLSKKALGQAEQSMFGGAAGVRDEVGFLIIHQRYADHFFPGTSVLHTRLRYALLIPWIFETLRQKRPAPRDFAQAYVDMEHNITGRLKFDGEAGEKDGVIGGEVYPKAIGQPPAYVYWTALAKWGLIGLRPDGRPWSRAEMAGLLAASRTRALLDDDGKPLDAVPWPIAGLPDPPSDWSGSGKLSLAMPKSERHFLSGKLKAVRSPADHSRPSLLSRLVGRPIAEATYCWDKSIVSLADDEAPMLTRAGQAAALSAIGRAVYAAQVETIKTVRDKRAPTTIHRDHLPKTIASWGKKAAALNLEAFYQEIGKLPRPVSKVLSETHEWVRKGGHDPMQLLETYARAERSRKQDRTRLSDNQFGIDRRLEWQAEKHGKAEPLHYRWGNIKRLLGDLTGAA
ncbi:hypothetical protein ACM41_06270 [Bradyrhizobium sp. CCBAU 21362]|uniref:DUF6361 family protein n=1 Tax=Bradyrhizobium sp. CCBAU 21362 TaxID=1325082 RepID=UPI0023058F6B|nr:DUF6361 family protein [Bradyrhizobium sp. CCBAU 21362]MDA9535881.1 hypothetical protein [Bradyrhizobium sp. CCBAU 21362]